MFPEGFLWGSSTNAQQFEGGRDEGGAGVSIADVRTMQFNTITESNFDEFKIASDHYHHVEEDLDLYAEMGFGIYRLSMAWTRIFPTGKETEPNEEGLAFYDRVIDGLIERGIQPVVTLYAYDCPQHLVDLYHGWGGREIVGDYTRYVRCVVEHFKGRVKYWVPFNEQNCIFRDQEYMTGYQPKNATETFQMIHNFSMAYVNAVEAVHELDPDAKVGGNIGNMCVYPKTCKPEDVEAADDYAYLFGYAFADIQCRGTYGKRFLNFYRKQGGDVESAFEPGDLERLSKVHPDFISITYYMSELAEYNENGIPVEVRANPYLESTEWGWPIDPYGFRHFIQDFDHRYQLPILILENGIGHRDRLEDDGSIHDPYRIDYHRDHIKQMERAVEDGANVIGYLTWSATDLYSTREGFEKRYGFVYVDKDDGYKRYRKDSFYWYQKVCQSNGADLV